MSTTPIAAGDADHRVAELLAEWSVPWFASGALAALDGSRGTDASAPARWLLRFRGEEKEFVTVWLTLRQRTAHFEVQVSPAPLENATELFGYLLRKNSDLFPLHLALGPEDAISLVGRVPVGELTGDRLDELCGAAIHDVEQLYPTIMAMGWASLYRRRRRAAT